MNKETKKWDYTFEIRKRIKPGGFILSEPYMADNHFKRSVCLICDHNKRDGTFGFILNKPVKKTLNFFIDEIEDSPHEVYYGGPVANDTLYYVHNNAIQLDGAQAIGSDLFWGGDFLQLKEMLINNTVHPSNIKFFLGYSGWDNGQLRKEIIENSWIVAEDIEPSQTFENPIYLGQNVMSKMGEMYHEMARFPEHPSLN